MSQRRYLGKGLVGHDLAPRLAEVSPKLVLAHFSDRRARLALLYRVDQTGEVGLVVVFLHDKRGGTVIYERAGGGNMIHSVNG